MQHSSELYLLSKYLPCVKKGTGWSWTVERLLLLHPSRSTNVRMPSFDLLWNLLEGTMTLTTDVQRQQGQELAFCYWNK